VLGDLTLRQNLDGGLVLVRNVLGRMNEINQRRAWMGDCQQMGKMGKSSRYVNSQPGQLSLAIPPWVGAVSTSKSWDVSKHSARCTNPVSVVSSCKPLSGWGL